MRGKEKLGAHKFFVPTGKNSVALRSTCALKTARSTHPNYTALATDSVSASCVVSSVLPMVYLTRLPILEHSVFCMLRDRRRDSPRCSRGGDEARERTLRVVRDVGRVVGVDIDGAEVGIMEVDKEARDKDCCEAV